MRSIAAMIPFVVMLVLAVPSFGQEEQKPEWVVGKMSVKLVRGVTNMATCVAELPKQTYLSIRDDGAVGYVIGPLKGVGMTILRALGGAAETAFFVVPQPGYFDPVMNPPYVWNGWECKGTRPVTAEESR